jgi:hypothetical protein
MATYTTTRGDTFESPYTDAEALARVATLRSEFARSLVQQHARRGTLSVRQWPWVHKLAVDADRPREEAPKGENVRGLLRFFDAAEQSGLKRPRITLSLKQGDLRLAVAGERSRYPGAVHVTDGGPFGRNQYWGRIDPDGTYRARHAPEWVVATLRDLADDPVGFVATYGQTAGHCCFCSQTLTTDESQARGYGPVCAERYGLPWG